VAQLQPEAEQPVRPAPRRRGDSGEPPSARQLGGGAGLIALAVLVAWLASGFYIVVEGQRGVILTFGKFSEVTTAGLHWRVPYPFQSNEIVDLTGVRTVEVAIATTSRPRCCANRSC